MGSLPLMTADSRFIMKIRESSIRHAILQFPTDVLESSVLMKHDLNVVKRPFLPCNKAYKYFLSLSCALLPMPCWKSKPNWQHLFNELLIKRWFCSKLLCLLYWMLSACSLQFIITTYPYFHASVDFDVSFSHIFLVLHQNSIGSSWFSLLIQGREIHLI